MTETTDHGALMRRALQEIKTLRSALAAARAETREPVALIGMGCRFPGGAEHPDAFWRLLENGVDSITEVPRSRWDVDAFYDPNPDAPGKMYTRHGGFVGDVDRFDAQFFGIPPLDALNLDPQQRLLLEVSWEALEHAGQVAGAVSRTGVYVGLFLDDYLQSNFHAAAPGDIDAYNTLGLLRGLAAGRLAYVLDLHGPAMQIDTACSSSLVAVHLAVQALRNRECDLALAGGANLTLSPEVTVGLCRMKAVAADGRCKTFDARADGYVRGEGCGMVVLRRLSDAVQDGDAIYAVIRGSAVNHDGRSNGLTAPNGTAQKALIREALADAGIEPAQVQYVEAHGTGTSLGDPIEAMALGEVLCSERAAPLYVGSVKTNFGHLESAAGAAALMKVALALHHGAIPASLHFQEPNPHIPWERLPLQVPTASMPWPTGAARIAGVSSFGMTGTNVHMLLEQAPQRPVEESRGFHVLTLSAPDRDALGALAKRYETFLAPGVSLRDVCSTSNVGRRHFDERLAIVADSVQSLAAKLRNHVPAPRDAKRPRVVFLFPDDRSPLSGSELQEWPVFRETIGARTLGENAEEASRFAFAVALARLWMSAGVAPDAVLGRGAGEYAAACTAGLLTFDRGLEVLATREPLPDVVAATPRTKLIRFGDAARGLRELGETIFVGIGSHAASIGMAAQIAAGDATTLPSVREGCPGQWLESLAALYERGFDVAWTAVQRGGTKVALPTYPFQRQRFWITRTRQAHAAGTSSSERLGRRLDLPPSRETHYESILSAASPSYLGDHRLDERVVVPAATYLAMAVESASAPVALEDVVFAQPLGFADDEERTLHLTVSDGFRFASRAGDGSWVIHCEGTFANVAPSPPAILPSFSGATVLDADADAGFAIGPSFRWTRDARRSDREVLCRMVSPLPAEIVDEYSIHPGLLDSCLRALSLCAPGAGVHLPFRIAELRFHAKPDANATLWCHAEADDISAQHIAGSVRLMDASGALLLEVRGLEARKRAETLLRLDWEAMAPSEVVAASERRTWLLVSGAGMRSFAEERGHAVVDTLGPDVTDVLFFCDGADAGPRLLDLLHRIDRLGSSPRVCIVTRGAQAVRPSDDVDPVQAWAWGLGRVIAMELPHLRCLRVDLERGSAEELGELFRLCMDRSEDQIAIRNGVTYVPRLVRTSLPHAAAPRFRDDCSYMITGAFGALGGEVARWMVGHGARHLILVGRTARTVELDADLRVVQADVADRASLERAFDTGMPPIRGIIHAAGVLDDGLLRDLTWERFESVMAPKARGAWNLHELSLGLELDFFVCFSSAASLLGARGQANYAAANSVMDAVVHHRRRLGLPGLSVNWGGWAESGMATRVSERMQAAGFRMLATKSALDALGRLIQSSVAQAGVVDADWPEVLASLFDEPPRMFSSLLPAVSVARERVIPLLERTAPEARRSCLEGRLRELIVSVIGRNPFETAPEGEPSFFEIGMDSLMSLDLRNRLQDDLDHTLASTVAFEYPTVPELVDHLIAEVLPRELFPS